MAESKQGSVKGILKSNKDRSYNPKFQAPETADNSEGQEGGVKWDEMNILQTHHPPGKDYGHMKIDEPLTPYRYVSSEDESEGEGKLLSEDALAEKLADEATVSRAQARMSGSYSDSDDEMSPEEKQKKKEFKEWRKKHYNEFQMMKKFRERRARGEGKDEEEEEEEEGEGSAMDTV